MPCSYERYQEDLAPSRFSALGIPRVRAVAVATIPLAFVALTQMRSTIWSVVGYAGAIASTVTLVLSMRHWTLKYWSDNSDRPLHSLNERNTVIIEARVDALLAMFDPNLHIAQQQVDIELAYAEKEILERRARKDWPPRWFGAVMLALLGTAMSLLSRASLTVVVAVVTMGALAASILLFGTLVVDEVFDSHGNSFAGYVNLLRLGKRRLSHEVTKSQATLRPVA